MVILILMRFGAPFKNTSFLFLKMLVIFNWVHDFRFILIFKKFIIIVIFDWGPNQNNNKISIKCSIKSCVFGLGPKG